MNTMIKQKTLSEVVRGHKGTLISDGSFYEINYCTKDVGRAFLCFIENPKFLSKIDSNVSCVLCLPELVDDLPEFVTGVFVCDEPKVLFHILLNNEAEKYQSNQKTRIGANCKISDLAVIADHDVVIGDNVIIEPFVVINPNVTIGNNVKIRSHSMIGGKSFSLVKTKQEEVLGLIDVGRVFIEDNVELLSGVKIEQGILPTDCTHIGKNVKIDVLSSIGHGSKIGDRTLIASAATIGGNAVIGEDVWIGLNATISNRIVIGNNSRVNLGSVVTQNVADNEQVSGNFAINHKGFISYMKSLKQKFVK